MGLAGGGGEPVACGLARLFIVLPLASGGDSLPLFLLLDGGDLGAAPATASVTGSLAARHRRFIGLQKGERVEGPRDGTLQQWRFS